MNCSEASTFAVERHGILEMIPNQKGRGRKVRSRSGLDDSHSLCFSSFGVEISIESNHPDAISASRKVIRDSFPASYKFIRHDYRSTHRFRINWNPSARDSLYKDGEPIIRSMKRKDVLTILASRLKLTVAEFSEEFVFLHSGAVVWNGVGIIMPGQSMQGKSTLVAEFVKRGAIYYSDDLAILDKNGALLPFAKTISLRGELPGLRQKEYTPASFGGKIGQKSAKIGTVLITKYRRGAKWSPRVVSGALGMIELIKHSIAIRRNPEFVLRVLNKIASDTNFIEGDRGEASIIVESIIASLGSTEFRKAYPDVRRPSG